MSRVKFFGRLYRCNAKAAPDNHGYTVEEMASANLKGKPIWVEHREPSVGEIVDHWVDKDGWLCITGEVYPRERIGELHDNVRSRIKNGELKELSIHWTGRKDASGKISSESKQFIEASLTSKGFYEGTKLISVAASANSNRQEVYQARGEIEMAEQPASEQDIMALIDEHEQKTGFRIDPNELRGRDSLSLAMYFMDANNKVKQTSEQSFQQERKQLQKQSSLTKAERERLAKYEAAEEEQRKRYAAANLARVEPIFEQIKDEIPEQERAQMQEALKAIAQNPDVGALWKIQEAFDNKLNFYRERAEKSSKELARQKKDYISLRKEVDEMRAQMESAQQQTVEVEASLKRSHTVGSDHTAKRQQMEKLSEAKGEVVEETASEFDQKLNRLYPRATSVPSTFDLSDSTNQKFLETLNSLQSQMNLGAGLPTFVGKGYNAPRF